MTGEFRITDDVITVECADTDTDGVVILGGEVTTVPTRRGRPASALIIREGDPDSVALVPNDDNAESCTELARVHPRGPLTDDERLRRRRGRLRHRDRLTGSSPSSRNRGVSESHPRPPPRARAPPNHGPSPKEPR